MYLDSAPHTVANSGLTLAAWKGTFASPRYRPQHCQITLRNSLASHWNFLHNFVPEQNYSHFVVYLAGTSTGAPLSFTKNITNFAGLVWLAFRPMT